MHKWTREWRTGRYIADKKANFKLVDSYLKTEPRKILDIGCGFAYESQWFQEKYDCDLYLMESDVETTKDNNRTIRYGSVDDFAFYTRMHELHSQWKSQGMRYTFVDANNPQVGDVTFDLVYSFLSCGYHYPANTYMDFILKHTTSDSLIILDIRHITKQKNINVIDVIAQEAKSQKLSIKFIDQ